MNVVFWFFVATALVFLWFLLSFTFRFIGNLLWRIYDEAKTEITKDSNQKGND